MTFLNQKKKTFTQPLQLTKVPVRIPSPGDVPKEKRKKGMLVTFLNQKKKTFAYTTQLIAYNSRVLIRIPSPGDVSKEKKERNVNNVPKLK